MPSSGSVHWSAAATAALRAPMCAWYPSVGGYASFIRSGTSPPGLSLERPCPPHVFEHMIEDVVREMTAEEFTAESRPRPKTRRGGAAAGQGSTAWPVFAPPVCLSSGPLGAVQAADREIARQTAVRARAVASFAASRPASVDRQQGEPGAMSPDRWAARPELLRPVSEWAAKELAVALSLTTEAAEALLDRSLTLVERLPGTLAALEAGALHPGHLWPLLDKVAPITDGRIRAQVEAELLSWAAGRVTTPAQLGAKARRVVARRDARAAARRLAQAVKKRGVTWRPDAVEGMGTVTALLTLPESRALVAALGAYADAIDDDTPTDAPGDSDPNTPGEGPSESAGAGPGSPRRTRGQKMADILLDLVLRPGETDLPPVQVVLNVVASIPTMLGGDQPGEIDGQPVPAEMIRQLLHTLTGHQPATAPDETGAAATEATATEATPAEAAAAGAVPTVPGGATGHGATGATGADTQAGAAGELPWQAREQHELSQWWAETQRRLLAGELLDPEPWTDEDFDAWVASLTPPDHPDDPDDPDPDTPDGLAGPDPGDEPPPIAEPLQPPPARDAAGAPSGDAAGASSGDGRWWAQADRAVDEAGQALRRLIEATAHARRLVRTATTADAADETAWQTGPAGRIDAAGHALTALAAATDQQRTALAGLLDATAGGGLAERPRILLTDALTGTLRALTDLPALRAAAHCGTPACRRHPEQCTHDLTGRPALGPPGPTDRYRPGAALDRWIRARDRRCRFPGCRRPVPRHGELDHHQPWPTGPTSAGNLAGYCTTDHRGKHQAPGWTHHLAPDGILTVTTPTGLAASTTPPPY
jgi:hypothetical protein